MYQAMVNICVILAAMATDIQKVANKETDSDKVMLLKYK